jgi:hypothetical protein
MINQLLERRSSRDREEFRTSELFLRLNEALAHRSWSQEVAWPIRDTGMIIRANPLFPSQRLYEVLTIYFPSDLDQEAICSIEMFRGLPCWHLDDGDQAEYPSAAVKSQIPAWIEGTCEYQRQTARRLAYFIEFADEKGERIYKEKVRYNPRLHKLRAWLHWYTKSSSASTYPLTSVLCLIYFVVWYGSKLPKEPYS